MLCAISGQLAEVPVASTKGGYVFEKRLIESHLEASARCPVSGEPLTKDDLVELRRGNVARPRAAAAQSLPGLLQAQQNEWDALMLENFELKKQLNTVRQELAHALYKQDAACRVIARLVKERDEAVKAVAGFEASAGGAKKGTGNPALDAMTATVSKVQKELSSKRKTRTISQTLASAAEVGKLAEASAHALHESTKPGVLCAARSAPDASVFATGGADGGVVLFNHEAQEVVQKFKAHAGGVTSLAYGPRGSLLSAGADGTVKVWARGDAGYAKAASLADHKKGVSSLALHPSGAYLASAGHDGVWCLIDVNAAVPTTVVKCTEVAGSTPLLAAAFHPDGMYLACGGLNAARVWDVRSQQLSLSLKTPEETVTALALSENGYRAATGSSKGGVRLWDLRKSDKELKLVTYPDTDPERPTPIHHMAYDLSGHYLSVCGDAVWVHDASAKSGELPQLVALEHAAAATMSLWGPDARTLYTTSMDRQFRKFAIA